VKKRRQRNEIFASRPAGTSNHLRWWMARTRPCRIPAFWRSPKTIRISNERILAAIEFGQSYSRPDGLNSKIRPINHRSDGNFSAPAVITLIDLFCDCRTENKPTEKAGVRQSDR
jgi:transposase